MRCGKVGDDGVDFSAAARDVGGALLGKGSGRREAHIMARYVLATYELDLLDAGEETAGLSDVEIARLWSDVFGSMAHSDTQGVGVAE